MASAPFFSPMILIQGIAHDLIPLGCLAESGLFLNPNCRFNFIFSLIHSDKLFVIIEGRHDPRYTGLIVHDLRRSAIKDLMKAGVNAKVAMKIRGHKTRDVFDRYHIVDTEDVVQAMRRVQASGRKGLVLTGEKSVKMPAGQRIKNC
jgi:hypothetical protein